MQTSRMGSKTSGLGVVTRYYFRVFTNQCVPLRSTLTLSSFPLPLNTGSTPVSPLSQGLEEGHHHPQRCF